MDIRLTTDFDPGDFDPRATAYKDVRVTRIDHDLVNRSIRFWTQFGVRETDRSFTRQAGRTAMRIVSGTDYTAATAGTGDLEDRLLAWLVSEGVYGGSVV